jgi:hypothetical protein
MMQVVAFLTVNEIVTATAITPRVAVVVVNIVTTVVRHIQYRIAVVTNVVPVPSALLTDELNVVPVIDLLTSIVSVLVTVVFVVAPIAIQRYVFFFVVFCFHLITS